MSISENGVADNVLAAQEGRGQLRVPMNGAEKTLERAVDMHVEELSVVKETIRLIRLTLSTRARQSSW